MNLPHIPKIDFKKAWASCINMLKANNAPHEIALGVAIGAFIVILPLYGLHTFICIIAAILIPRANKLAIFIGTNISIPPTIVPITFAAYDIGRYLLRDKHYQPLTWDYIRHFHISKVSELYFPLFVGSVVLGAICAGILYAITYLLSAYFKRRRASMHDHINDGSH